MGGLGSTQAAGIPMKTAEGSLQIPVVRVGTTGYIELNFLNGRYPARRKFPLQPF